MYILSMSFDILFSYVLPFLLVIMPIIIIHEYGHFIVARWCGVKVDVFSIGFGKQIWGFYDKKGTKWKISWVPLGGYVKFFGDANEASQEDKSKLETLSEEEKSQTFYFKPLWQKSLIVAAGPAANFLSAFVILACALMFYGKSYLVPRVAEVVENGPAYEAGIKPGDIVVSVDGRQIETFSRISSILMLSAGNRVPITVDRAGVLHKFNIIPDSVIADDGFGSKIKKYQIGIIGKFDRSDVSHKKFGLFEAAKESVNEIFNIVRIILVYIHNIIFADESADQLGGPIKIASVAGKVAEIGFGAMLSLIVNLSVSIGLINLFPIPVLDGGHLVFYAYEGIFRKPLNKKIKEYGFSFGFALILMLLVFVTWNDIVQLNIF